MLSLSLRSFVHGSAHTAARSHVSRNDEGKTLQMVAKAGGGASLYIDGELRTEVTEEPLANNMSICAVVERVGGAIHMLSHLDDCRDKKQYKKGYSNPAAVVLENPQIAFSTANLAVTHTLAASEGPLAPLPGVRDASLLQGDLACEPQLQSATGLFLRDGDAYWRHDPRLQLLSNTLEQPYNGSVSGAVLPNVDLPERAHVRTARATGQHRLVRARGHAALLDWPAQAQPRRHATPHIY